MALVEDESEVRAQPLGHGLEGLGRHVEHASAHVALDVGVAGMATVLGVAGVVVVLRVVRVAGVVVVLRLARLVRVVSTVGTVSVARLVGRRCCREVVDGGRAAEVDVREHAGLDERGEGAVDGGPVHRRNEVGDARADLLGGQVLVGEVGGVHDAEHGIPSGGHPLSGRAQGVDGHGHATAVARLRASSCPWHGPSIAAGRLSPCAHSRSCRPVPAST